MVVLAVVVAALAFLAYKGLGDATTYYRNVDEAIAERDELGTRRFRLQGVVLPGTVVEDGPDVRFTVEWHCATLDVLHSGSRPELFRPGIPVVVEGSFVRGAGEFRSDAIIVKHTEEYKDSAEQLENEADLEACPS
jgi:cytochrome c-type biogenesis protein CcmE